MTEEQEILLKDFDHRSKDAVFALCSFISILKTLDFDQESQLLSSSLCELVELSKDVKKLFLSSLN